LNGGRKGLGQEEAFSHRRRPLEKGEIKRGGDEHQSSRTGEVMVSFTSYDPWPEGGKKKKEGIGRYHSYFELGPHPQEKGKEKKKERDVPRTTSLSNNPLSGP